MTGVDPLILLVEDDESLCRIVSRYLRARGYRIDVAPSAEVAEHALRNGPRPALVLLDLNLPGNTGWDLLRGDAVTSAGDPPVVITSATPVSPKRLTEFHVAGYLPKPFPLETLVATIDRSIAKEAVTPAHE